MIISKKVKTRKRCMKKFAALRINKKIGQFIFNLTAKELLEIDDVSKEGVVFGYNNTAAYVGYSNEDDCFKGYIKKDEGCFRFGNVVEATKLFDHYNIKEHISAFEISTAEQDIEIYNGYKLYKLIELK